MADDMSPRGETRTARHGARGPTSVSLAEEIGMQCAYGYGATMGAWITDYVAYWAGHNGLVRYSWSCRSNRAA